MREDELTSSEKEALEALPKEQTPSALLEERVVKSLRSRGVLRPRKRRTIEVTPLRVACAVAASIAVVVAGFTAGRWTGSRDDAPERTRSYQAADASLAVSLQRTGSAYVSALEDLASLPESDTSDEIRQSREVALVALCTAARQAAEIVPRNRLASQLLLALDVKDDRTTGERSKTRPQVMWF